MSLVNRMLQDLETRHAASANGAAVLDGLQPAALAQQGKARSWHWLWLVLAAGGVLFYWLGQSRPDPFKLPAPELHAPVAPQATAMVAAPVASGQENATEQPLPAPDEPVTLAILDTRPLVFESQPQPAARLDPVDDTATPLQQTLARLPGGEAVFSSPKPLSKPSPPSQMPAVSEAPSPPVAASPPARPSAVPAVTEIEISPLLEARQLMQSGQTQAAIERLRASLSDSDDPEARRLLSRLLQQQGDNQAALALWSADRDRQLDARSSALVAALAQRAGAHARAAALYRQAIANGQSGGRQWLGLGISLERLQQPVEAASAFLQAVDSGDLDARVTRWARARLKAQAERADILRQEDREALE